jgi:predicted signal transduction protein with EAL and GGDEF domain
MGSVGCRPADSDSATATTCANRDADVSLYEVMQDGKGVLLDASSEGKLSELVAATTQRIRCVAVDEGLSMLIRPDACIAWAGEENNTGGLREALRRWFIPTVYDGSMVRSEHRFISHTALRFGPGKLPFSNGELDDRFEKPLVIVPASVKANSRHFGS